MVSFRGGGGGEEKKGNGTDFGPRERSERPVCDTVPAAPMCRCLEPSWFHTTDRASSLPDRAAPPLSLSSNFANTTPR